MADVFDLMSTGQLQMLRKITARVVEKCGPGGASEERLARLDQALAGRSPEPPPHTHKFRDADFLRSWVA